jgi:hypothetical protein
MLKLNNMNLDLTFLSNAAQAWQNLVIIAVGLSVGYAMARKFEGLLGKNKKGDTLIERLEKIERQITPNGGSSMLDKIDYIRRDQNKMKQQISEISGELKVIKDIVTVIVDK